MWCLLCFGKGLELLCQHSLIKAQLCDACAHFSKSAAHTSRTLSLQGALLCQAALCQSDIECLLLHFLQVISAEAEMLRLAVCKLYSGRYIRVEDVMTASLSSRTQQVSTSQSWTQSWTPELGTAAEGNKPSGLVCNRMFGMA
jgi:hypothetical protein